MSYAVFDKTLSNIAFTFNVGIGTTVALAPLHVQGNQYVSGNLGIGTTAPLTPFHLNAVGYVSGAVGIGSTMPISPLDVNVASSSNAVRIRQSGAADALLVSTVASANALRVMNDGKVGVGTATALTTHHVQGTSYTSGNLGIGTTIPTERLHVFDGSAEAAMMVQSGTGVSRGELHMMSSTADSRVAVGYLNRPLYIGRTDGTSAGTQATMVFTTGDNVGVGTTDPQEKLHVIGNILASGTVTASNLNILGKMTAITTTTSNAQQMVINNAGTGPALKVVQSGANTVAEFTDAESGTVMFMANGGNIGVGTSSPSGKFEIIDENNTLFYLTEYNNTDGAVIRARRARGTLAAPSAVQTNDVLTGLRGFGHNGTSFGSISGYIDIRAAENHTSTAQGSYMSFITTPITTTTPSERLRITSEGNVGIGTTTPGEKLAVEGNVIIRGANTETRSLEIGIGRTGNGTSYLDFVGDATYSDYGLRVIRNNAGANTTSAIQHRGTGDMQITTQEAAAVVVSTTNTERMRIASDGNVGVGTATALAKLHVSGDIKATSSSSTTGVIVNCSDVNTIIGNVAGTTNAGSIQVRAAGSLSNVGANTYTLSIQPDGGNVGIGTASPAGVLDIYQSSASGRFLIRGGDGLEIGNTRTQDGNTYVDLIGDTTYTDYGARLLRYSGANGGTLLTQRGTGALTIHTQDSAPIILTTAQTERIRIDAGGNVGVGTSTPLARFHVNGEIGVEEITDVNALQSTTTALYPPVYNFNAYTMYIHGLKFTVSASSVRGSWAEAYNVFGPTGAGWESNDGAYALVTGAATYASMVAGYNGAWVKIQYPTRFVLKSYTMFGQNAYDFRIYASNDNVTWTQIDEKTNITDPWTQTNNVSVTNTTGYFYYAVIFNRGDPGYYQRAVLNKWYLYGIVQNTVGFARDTGIVGGNLTVATNIGIGTTAPQAKFHVVGDTRLETIVDSYQTRTFPYAQLPTTHMNANISYLFGGRYTARASTERTNGLQAWSAFTVGTNQWHSTDGMYDASSNYTGTRFLASSNYKGEWVSIELPVATTVSAYSLNMQTSTFRLYGSLDLMNWVQLDDRTSYTPNTIISINNTTAYKSYGVVINKHINTNFGRAWGNSFLLYGTVQNLVGFNQNAGVTGGDFHVYNGNIGIGTASPSSLLDVYEVPYEFPPSPMTANSTSIHLGSYRGTYVASSSSTWATGEFQPFQAFNKNILNDFGFISFADKYNADGTSAAGSGSTSGYAGEWLQIQMPSAFVVNRFSLTTRIASYRGDPKDFRIYGSTDGSTWTQLYEKTNDTFSGFGVTNHYIMNNSTAYTYYRLAVNKITLENTAGKYLTIQEWRLYGMLGSTAANVLKIGVDTLQTGTQVNVGIGTTNPFTKLHIHEGNVICYSASATSPYIACGNGGNSWMGMQSVGNSYLRLGFLGGANINDTLCIGNGNVGIGLTDPSTKLDVWGKVRFRDTGNLGPPTNGVNGGNGTTIIVWPGGANYTPYALGMDAGSMWYGVPSTASHIWYTGTNERARINGDGNVGIGVASPSAKLHITQSAGTPGIMYAYSGTSHVLSLYVGGTPGNGGWNGGNTILYLSKDSVTNRSINAAGSINNSGNDYAEYMMKDGDFVVAKGDIVGVKANGKLTNIFSEAVAFTIKSTNPSIVGGDSWGTEDIIGSRPLEPSQDATDEDKLKYKEDLAAWTQAFEAERAKVDRVAFAGQVPVNVYGATPGDYIVPTASDSDSICGIAISDADITFSQYKKAVGKVINILDDGRANVIVKVA